jgi:hypothetical protein
MATTRRVKTKMAVEFLRLASISGMIFIFSFIIILSILGWAYRDKIKSLFIESLNHHLRTEIFVDEIKLDVFRKFPLASLTLNGITVIGTETIHTSDTLLYARKLHLQFRILDIIRKNYTLKQLTINNGFINASIDDQGSGNFEFWDNNTPSTQENFQLELQRILLNNIQANYHDKRSNHLLKLDIKKASIKGMFKNASYELSVFGDIHGNEISIDSLPVIRDKPVKIDITVHVENNTSYHFSKGLITIHNHDFSVTGNLIKIDEGLAFDTRIEGNKLTLQNLLDDMPDKVRIYTSQYHAKGELAFTASIKGSLTPTENPLINASFSLKQGEMTHPDTKLKLKDLSFEGTFNNGELKKPETTILSIQKLNASMNDGTVRGGITIENILMPHISFNVYADMRASDMRNLLHIDAVKSVSGRMTLDLAFQGAMSERNRFTGIDLINTRASGNISAINLGFTTKNTLNKVHGINGNLLFRNNDLLVETFYGNIGSSDFAISGFFRNVLPYLLLEGESIQVDASLYSKLLDFDELLKTNNIDNDEGSYKLSFSDQLGFLLYARVDNLRFRRFEAFDLAGNVSLNNKQFLAENISFRSMNGHVNASATIDGTKPDILYITCMSHLNRVDVHQLFYQMGNFGQKGILDENIFGIMTSAFQFSSQWTPSLEIDWGSLQTNANIVIEDGVLVDYEPMNALGRFLRVDDLSRVTFSTLENNIHIKDRMIIIPDMEINSNVINLKLSGKHSFENQIEYHLQILLSEILSRKNRERRNPQEQYGNIMDDGLGRTTLFLKVDGHIDKPVFSYDHQGVRQKLVDDLRKERASLLDALEKEFSFLGRSDESQKENPKTPKQLEMERLKKQEEGKMIIEWEDF